VKAAAGWRPVPTATPSRQPVSTASGGGSAGEPSTAAAIVPTSLADQSGAGASSKLRGFGWKQMISFSAAVLIVLPDVPGRARLPRAPGRLPRGTMPYDDQRPLGRAPRRPEAHRPGAVGPPMHDDPVTDERPKIPAVFDRLVAAGLSQERTSRTWLQGGCGWTEKSSRTWTGWRPARAGRAVGGVTGDAIPRRAGTSGCGAYATAGFAGAPRQCSGAVRCAGLSVGGQPAEAWLALACDQHRDQRCLALLGRRTGHRSGERGRLSGWAVATRSSCRSAQRRDARRGTRGRVPSRG
jgi:hypothetical protein